MNCSRCLNKVMWKENGRTIVEGSITNINGVVYVECKNCKITMSADPEPYTRPPPTSMPGAAERFHEGVERYIGTPKQLSTLFWAIVITGIVATLIGLILMEGMKR